MIFFNQNISYLWVLIKKTKYPIYKLMPALLAAIIFIATTGFSIDIHYCQGNIKSFALNANAKTCSNMDENSKKDLCDRSSLTISKKQCCQSINGYHIADLDMDLHSFNLNQDFDLKIVEGISELKDANKNSYLNRLYALCNSPPKDDSECYLMIQSFLI